MAHLIRLDDSFSDQRKMNQHHIPDLAQRVYDNFYYWNEADLELIINEIIDGKHKLSFGGFDIPQAMAIFNDYDNRRTDIAEQVRGEESEGYKKRGLLPLEAVDYKKYMEQNQHETEVVERPIDDYRYKPVTTERDEIIQAWFDLGGLDKTGVILDQWVGFTHSKRSVIAQQIERL